MKHFLLYPVAACMLFAGREAVAGDIKGKITATGARDNANAVVFIEKIPGKSFPAPKKHEMMNQKNLTFIPHILPVLAGTTVDFLNSDDVLHNVYSPDPCADKFNLGSWPKGQKKEYTFKNPGCRAVLLCNVHPEMEGYVVVLETPYFAVTAKDGSYEIKGVPAGTYTLSVWHEKLKGAPLKVDVPAQGTSTADFSLKR